VLSWILIIATMIGAVAYLVYWVRAAIPENPWRKPRRKRQ
jgi:hypothetical protein